MADGTMIYDKMGLSDMSTGLLSFSQELQQIADEAHGLLAASPEFFQSDNGAANYQQAQQLINDGIQDGKDVIARHGNVIDQSSSNFTAADVNVGNGFQGA
jgi:hypothetical protein